MCENNVVVSGDANGLWTIQIGIASSGGVAAGGQGGFGIVFGYSKNRGFQFGVYGMAGGAPGTFVGAGGALTGEVMWSRNEHISDLHGPAVAIGGSASFGPGAGVNIGIEGAVPLSDGPHCPEVCYTVSVGVGIGTPEFHNIIGQMSILQLVGKPK